MDSTLIWPYHTKVVRCAGCGHQFVTRYFGSTIANLIAGANEAWEVEKHVRECKGQRAYY